VNETYGLRHNSDWNFAEKTDEPLKTTSNVVKVVGPQGGLRSLGYE